MDTIIYARRSLLFDESGNPWVKRDTQKEFDVTMGAYDGAEIAELVGLYILQTIKTELTNINAGLYSDDGLAVIKGTGRTVDKVRKDITKIFQSLGLKITVQANLKNVDFLDVNFDLPTGLHKPHRKRNDEPLYIDTGSNHPPEILKHIHPSIEKRISALFSNEEIFEKAAPIYNQALRNSGHNGKITYEKNT
ncbi:hypothetical protein HOLleu_05625 [Holothuria leucospilota]|uniref:Uncharacterized protein n=1 Tax=Holothuria leucospilota TaxID=206669 RepID=A0A9Q1CLP8_HOLLE|nr:hypothetical protein HOLleu_05625 [Holothuria leucospilota]